MLKFTIWMVLCLFIAASLLAINRPPSTWSVQRKAELMAELMLAKKPIFDSARNITFYIPKTSDYFQPQHAITSKEEAENDARLIFSYVIADSLPFYNSVRICFAGPTDTIWKAFACNKKETSRLHILDEQPEDRQLLIGNALPFPSLVVANPSAKYRKRIMGFSLPDKTPGGQQLYTLQMSRYALVLASALYDFALHRNDDIVSKVVIKYSENYGDLDAPPVSECLYLPGKMIFKAIKENNLFPLDYE